MGFQQWRYQGEIFVFNSISTRNDNGKSQKRWWEGTDSSVRGDPSAIPCFRTSPVAEDAIFGAVRSAKFNGAIQAIEIVMSVLARPGANILLPKPGYSFYEARAACSNVEVRHFDLLPEKGWEVDLESVKALVDDNTIAIVIINPGNPCRNVFTSEHLQEVGVKLINIDDYYHSVKSHKLYQITHCPILSVLYFLNMEIAETAKKLGILVIADEVYSHLCFGSKPFVPMGVFGSITPILTLGSISKRWIIPGWRLGWIAMVDPSGVLKKSGGAVPHILEKMTKEFFSNINNVLKEAVDAFHTKVQEIPCFTCPYKPDGAMSVMVRTYRTL
ncbi:hypothetical protein RND71_034826 [Anisodus tanguticus]|uniref:Aminotransferase class I/classII large domain-containing protein n=1 Tax=Anisodus tanguticus TaxID=243964 RepID=A0AAE1V1K9_9SOLA|nr:hypothetical protein RND71_034826 [Anisodus tanguticus]